MERLESGAQIGAYRVEARIGRGGMGVVYRATHVALGKQVALKVIAEELAEDEGFRERFRREPKLAASIDHPHVIPVYDAGEVGEHLFVAMRYVEGSDLGSLIADEGRLDPERGVQIVAQVADGLDAAHELGLVHRDVKPANVMIENRRGREHAYLTDFGLTKGGEGSAALTKTGQWVGTPDYVAPEQIHGGTLDRRTDIYALGGVLYHVLSGQPPYGRETEVAKIYAHLSKPPPELPADAGASPELNATIRRAMAKETEERYPTAGEFARDALAAVGMQSGSSQLVVPPTVPARAPTASDPGAAEAPSGAALEPAETPVAPGHSPPERVEQTPGEALARGDATVAGDTAGLATSPPVQPTAPQPSRRPALLADRRKVGALAVLTGAVFVVAGFLIGTAGGDDDAPSFANEASVGSLQFRYPDGWKQSAQDFAIPGIKFNDRINFAPAGKVGLEGLAAGQVTAAGPRLLPKGFLQRLGGKPPNGKPVELDNVEALLYRNLEPKGFKGEMTLFATPTTQGVATSACTAPAGASETITAQCDQIAATLRLIGARSFPIGPDKEYAKTLSQAMNTLNEAREKQLEHARDAKAPAAQAAAFGSLATSFRKVAQDLGTAQVSPAAEPANAAIVGAVQAGSAAYAAMATAARSDNEAAYKAARARAGSADAELQRALRKLEALGYEVK